MRIPRIHTPQPLTADTLIELDDNAFNHAVRVLRLKEGAPLVLFNGEGGEFEATLSVVERKRAQAQVAAFIDREVESPLRITLGQAISKGERMDYTIQKAVELGVDTIVPLFSEHCAVQLKGDRLEKKIQHWQAVVISACEQSGRNRVPQVAEATDLGRWLQQAQAGLNLVLDPRAESTLSTLSHPEGPVTLLMGPEGGLSDAEVDQALRNGFTGVRLGPRILRTETAAVAALGALQTLWGDFR